MKFTLEIELGNAAMETCQDIAGALADLAGRLADNGSDVPAVREVAHGGTIRDVNGNTVGRWAIA